MMPTNFDMTRAHDEGWEIKVGDDGHPAIFGLVDFRTDAEAVDYVLRKCADGHDYHNAAVKIVLTQAPFMSRPTFTINTIHGELIADFENGAVITAPPGDKAITMIDVGEWLDLAGDYFHPGACFNLHLLGYWKGEEYVDPHLHRTAYMLANTGASNWMSKAFRAALMPSGQYIVTYTIVVEAGSGVEAAVLLEDALDDCAVVFRPANQSFPNPLPVLIAVDGSATLSEVRAAQAAAQAAPTGPPPSTQAAIDGRITETFTGGITTLTSAAVMAR